MNIQATCQKIGITKPAKPKKIKELLLQKNNNLCLKIVLKPRAFNLIHSLLRKSSSSILVV